MQKWLRRIRAAIGMGVVWGAAWAGAGFVLLLIVGFGAADVPFPLVFGVLGFLAGATFSAILATLGRRRRFDEMSLPRFASWGALGGVLLAGGFSLATGLGREFLGLGPLFAAAGAICASGTLALARRATGAQLLEQGYAANGSLDARGFTDVESPSASVTRPHRD